MLDQIIPFRYLSPEQRNALILLLEGSVRLIDHQRPVLRFLYYTSDLPLQHDSNLSARLRASEGVPPLYAITREVLTGILERQAT